MTRYLLLLLVLACTPTPPPPPPTVRADPLDALQTCGNAGGFMAWVAPDSYEPQYLRCITLVDLEVVVEDSLP